MDGDTSPETIFRLGNLSLRNHIKSSQNEKIDPSPFLGNLRLEGSTKFSQNEHSSPFFCLDRDTTSETVFRLGNLRLGHHIKASQSNNSTSLTLDRDTAPETLSFWTNAKYISLLNAFLEPQTRLETGRTE